MGETDRGERFETPRIRMCTIAAVARTGISVEKAGLRVARSKSETSHSCIVFFYRKKEKMGPGFTSSFPGGLGI